MPRDRKEQWRPGDHGPSVALRPADPQRRIAELETQLEIERARVAEFQTAEDPSFVWGKRDGQWWLVVCKGGEPFAATLPPRAVDGQHEHGHIIARRDMFTHWAAIAVPHGGAS